MIYLKSGVLMESIIKDDKIAWQSVCYNSSVLFSNGT